MAWYDDAWRFRKAITFANNTEGQVTGSATPEGLITFPRSFGKFWTNVQSDFSDVRIMAADGVTPLDWAFNGTPSVANRTAQIQIDETNHNVSTLYGSTAANASVGAWLYWGNDDSNLASGANNSINITTTPKTVAIDLVEPLSSSTAFLVTCSALDTSRQFYQTEIRKGTAEITRIYWDLSSVVSRLKDFDQSSRFNEEIAYVTAIIYDQDGANTTAAMTTKNEIKILDGYFVSMPIKGGDHEKRYAIHLTVGLVDHSGSIRVTDQRCTLHVRNPAIHPALSIS